MDLNALQLKINNYITVVSSWVRNVGKLYFSGTPENVTVELIDDNGNLVTKTLPNVAQFRKRVWDDVGGALGQFNRTFYVDEINGDDSNDGSSSSPFKNIHTAFSKIPNSGKAVIILLSDCSYSQDVTKYGIIAEVRLNGHKLSLVKSYLSDKALLFCLNGYGNTVYFTGNFIDDSSVELPALGDDTLFSVAHSVFIKSNSSAEPEFSSVHFGYGVELIDNGDFYISTCAGSTCMFSVSGCTFTQNNGTRGWLDIVSGVIRDADSGNPINLLSNVNFSS